MTRTIVWTTASMTHEIVVHDQWVAMWPFTAPDLCNFLSFWGGSWRRKANCDWRTYSYRSPTRDRRVRSNTIWWNCWWWRSMRYWLARGKKTESLDVADPVLWLDVGRNYCHRAFDGTLVVLDVIQGVINHLLSVNGVLMELDHGMA